MKCEPANRENI